MKQNKFQKLLNQIPEDIKKSVEKQNEFSNRLASVLIQKKIKQKEFAKTIGMKESQLSKILSGNANLTLRTISKIEYALGVNIIEMPSSIQKEIVNVFPYAEYSSFVYNALTSRSLAQAFSDNLLIQADLNYKINGFAS